MAAQDDRAQAPGKQRPQSPPKCDRPPQLASLYVGDLHPEVGEADLVAAFSEMGDVASVRVCRDAASGRSLCYGYVNFFSHFLASKALACLNYSKLKGKPMRIMWCQRDPSRRKAGNANLFVKNLDPSISSARLQSIFCQYGNILSCKVAEDNGSSKGFGFVQFESEESAMNALRALHDTMLEGKNIYVSKFVKKSERTSFGEEPEFTNLYVKNLEEDITMDHLQDKFSEYGKVSNVVIMKDIDGKSRGFGFVNFESPQAAKKAVEALNGTIMGSKILFVGRAQKKAEREQLLKDAHQVVCSSRVQKSGCNLYAKNLDLSIDDRKLQEYFSSFGTITSAKVMRDGNGLSKGFGFVCFSNCEEAKRALNTLNGIIFRGKPLYVAIAQQKDDRSRNLQEYRSQIQPQSRHHSYLNPLPGQRYAPPYNTPLFHLPYTLLSQSIHHQYVGANAGLPYATESYREYHSTSVPGRHAQTQEGNSNNWVYGHHLTTYSTSGLHGQDQKFCKPKVSGLGIRKRGNRKFLPAENTTNRTRSLPAPSSQGTCTRTLGNLLYPLVENIQVNKVDQVLREANTRTIASGGMALPKSARCLNY
ncbi:hypothetical protein ACJRO7_024964 [Eucalyptus globulus]|uniref:RRM domain-containing protein n=1 Tax=Eucalyptus globulus TaxID=34317 RepID=A0ABD3KAH5_EUCGL